MREIELTQEKVALVDDEDYEWLNQWKWYAWFNGWSFYAVRSISRNKSKIFMHRLVFNAPKKAEVDHVDHNGLNNQKNNLRLCTRKQNACNRSPSGRSKYLGVTIENNKSHKRIRAQIKINGKSFWIGTFDTEIEAAVAYDNVAKVAHKEFANLNFKPFS